MLARLAQLESTVFQQQSHLKEQEKALEDIWSLLTDTQQSASARLLSKIKTLKDKGKDGSKDKTTQRGVKRRGGESPNIKKTLAATSSVEKNVDENDHVVKKRKGDDVSESSQIQSETHLTHVNSYPSHNNTLTTNYTRNYSDSSTGEQEKVSNPATIRDDKCHPSAPPPLAPPPPPSSSSFASMSCSSLPTMQCNGSEPRTNFNSSSQNEYKRYSRGKRYSDSGFQNYNGHSNKVYTQTGGGGSHVRFSSPEDRRNNDGVTNSDGKRSEGGDTRGQIVYVRRHSNPDPYSRNFKQYDSAPFHAGCQQHIRYGNVPRNSRNSSGSEGRKWPTNDRGRKLSNDWYSRR